MNDQTPWLYDPAEHRTKHCGTAERAEFVQDGSAYIGKCPITLSKTEAQNLLQHGIPEHTDTAASHPERIFAYHQGVIYVAVPTEPGKSYHGYPWRGRPGNNRVPPAILVQLKQIANQQGESKLLSDWLKAYSS